MNNEIRAFVMEQAGLIDRALGDTEAMSRYAIIANLLDDPELTELTEEFIEKGRAVSARINELIKA